MSPSPAEPSPLEEIRPLTAREREKLREFSEVPNRLTTSGIFTRLGFLALGCILALLPVVMVFQWTYFAMVAGIAVVVLGMSLYKYFNDERTAEELEEREKAILRDPRARVEHLEPLRAVEVELPHRQWPLYILELPGNRLVLLQGPHLLDSDDDIPSSSFDLVTTVVDDVWLGIFSAGKFLDPPLEKAPETWDGDRWPDTLVVNGKLDLGVAMILQIARNEVARLRELKGK